MVMQKPQTGQYEDQQTLNRRQPLPVQKAIPGGVHELEFSWARGKYYKVDKDGTGHLVEISDTEEANLDGLAHALYYSWMRITIPAFKDLLVSTLKDQHGNPVLNKDGEPVEHRGTWFFKEMAGNAVVTGTNNPHGVILMQASAQVDGDILYLRRPKDVPPLPPAPGQRLPRAKYRLCYRRAYRDWRVRDEEMPWNDERALHFCRGYIGDLAGSWFADPLAHIFHHQSVILRDDGLVQLVDESLS
jgi:hypothetical protein